jgi:ABC-type glycerol-3-phosphate transport system substrate-binding protein
MKKVCFLFIWLLTSALLFSQARPSIANHENLFYSYFRGTNRELTNEIITNFIRDYSPAEYRNNHQNEFAWRDIINRSRTQISSRIANVNLSTEYYFDMTINLPNYDFDREGFPVRISDSYLCFNRDGFSFGPPTVNIFSDVGPYSRHIILFLGNISSYDIYKLNSVAANAFLRSRTRNGNVDRRVTLRVYFEINNFSPNTAGILIAQTNFTVAGQITRIEVYDGQNRIGELSRREGIVVWSFTDELGKMINNYYRVAFPDAVIDYSHTNSEQFQSRLDPVLASGRGVPDIIALEAAFIRKYVESGLLLDLTDIYERNRNSLLAYPVEIGTYNGRVYAMSWQAYPGAMFYRRSLARRYLGTDDPAVVQTYFSDLNKFIETAELLRQRSNGACVVVSSRGDLYNPFLGARSQPWVVNNRLVIDPAMEAYMDMSKLIHDNRYDARVGQWSEGWFAGMNDSLRDENGRQLEAFSYFLPTWGLHYVLKTNATRTFGDWAMIPGPAPYRWGGTWIGAWKDTRNPEGVKHMIEWLTTNDDFLYRYALDTGDMVSNTAVVNRIKDNFSEPFLGGQNHYAAFAEMAMTIDGKLVQGTDQAIEGLFAEAVTAYVAGEKTKQQALADFRQQVQQQLGLN